jgi:hypothetical protein
MSNRSLNLLECRHDKICHGFSNFRCENGMATTKNSRVAMTNFNQSKKTKPTKQKMSSTSRLLTGGALVLAIASAVYAQEKPYTQPGLATPIPPPPTTVTADAKATASATPPEPNPVDKFFNGKIPEAIMKGKFSLNARLRYEYVEQDGVAAITEPSHAPTIRTRFGYTTAPLYGFQGMIEAENISVIGNDHNFNAAGTSHTPNKPVVADPETTEINQAWLGYTYTNWISAKLGRQRIVLDNHRFIGDVGWRQNMQTYDAASFESKPIDGLTLFYAYVWEVNRVFGDLDTLPAANRDFDHGNSHLFNVSYSPFKYGRFGGYTYLLDLENQAGFANSCATYGGYFSGSASVTEKISLGYHAEFAYQTDYKDSPQDYGAEYYNFELSATMKPVSLGGGYEVLGTDSNDAGAGSVGFRTPLATLHAFNGWADVFLNTPAKGLRDVYGFVQVTLPADVPVRFIYHKFDADSGGGDFGQELDVVASKKFGKNWTVTTKYAYYDGKEAPARFDVQKFWAQVEFNF